MTWKLMYLRGEFLFKYLKMHDIQIPVDTLNYTVKILQEKINKNVHLV